MKKHLSYMDSVHHYGRIWNLSMCVVFLAFPIAIALIFNAAPVYRRRHGYRPVRSACRGYSCNLDRKTIPYGEIL